jgi:antibiotic biosynthesis monooxygenase (ABM) superfamily enzyme
MLGVLNMAAGSSDSSSLQPVHVAILRTVREGSEGEFERRVAEFFAEAANQPGVCGAYLIRPVAGSMRREYGILRTFRSEADMQRFYESPIYERWERAVRPLVEGEPQKRPLHGLEAFFRGTDASPPRWKMALLTFVAVNAAVYFFSAVVPLVFGPLPMIVGFLLVNALVVASLTWALMPLLSKISGRWLKPRRQS